MTDEWDGELGTREGLYHKSADARHAKLLIQRLTPLQTSAMKRILQFLKRAEYLTAQHAIEEANLLWEYRDVTGITNPDYVSYANTAPNSIECDFHEICLRVRLRTANLPPRQNS